MLKFDGIVKSAETVIPANAGIQHYLKLLDPGACPGLDPGFAGVTEICYFRVYDFIRFNGPIFESDV